MRPLLFLEDRDRSIVLVRAAQQERVESRRSHGVAVAPIDRHDIDGVLLSLELPQHVSVVPKVAVVLIAARKELVIPVRRLVVAAELGEEKRAIGVE